jgi:urease accessory protein
MNSTRAVKLLQFGDSVLPIGSFSFSNALESAVQRGVVSDVATLRSFVRTSTYRAATSDGIALLEAHRAASVAQVDRLVRADREVIARKLNEEMRTQSVRTGKKLVEVAASVLNSPLLQQWLGLIKQGATPGTYPVGLGFVGAEAGLEESDSFAIHQYGVAMTILGAALRLMKVDHLDTQTILFEVNSECELQYREIAGATLDHMSSFAPMTDVLAAAHVRAHVRMFMN